MSEKEQFYKLHGTVNFFPIFHTFVSFFSREPRLPSQILTTNVWKLEKLTTRQESTRQDGVENRDRVS